MEMIAGEERAPGTAVDHFWRILVPPVSPCTSCRIGREPAVRVVGSVRRTQAQCQWMSWRPGAGAVAPLAAQGPLGDRD
jgi:hypothetical protein